VFLGASRCIFAPPLPSEVGSSPKPVRRELGCQQNSHTNGRSATFLLAGIRDCWLPAEGRKRQFVRPPQRATEHRYFDLVVYLDR
jgi:hypothetical protein